MLQAAELARSAGLELPAVATVVSVGQRSKTVVLELLLVLGLAQRVGFVVGFAVLAVVELVVAACFGSVVQLSKWVFVVVELVEPVWLLLLE